MNYSLLKNLRDGTPFNFRSGNVFRNLYLVKGSDSRCIIAGERAADNSTGWEQFTDSCAPDAEVLVDTDRNNFEMENKNEKTSVKEEKTNKNKQTNKENNNNMKGRKRIHNINLPVDQEFTVASVAQTLNVEKYVINNELARIKRETPDRVTEVSSVKGGRGKPAKVFKITA